MEKISAACAMDWSIELDKGLRSKRPGEPIKAIEQIGQRLHRWSKEPEITLGISKMYGLVQGEERMFANAILLRFADAFKTGNREMRASIVKVFLLELREIMKKGRHYDGILAKQRVPNYQEILRRVKWVFDSGNVRDRALSLRLYGCWVDLVSDNADVRYIIISSLTSRHDLEVKASLFAAGCICRLSEDFACIILGMLVDILCSNASCNVKIAAARAFVNMQCSSLIVNRAYKVGKQLLHKFELDELIHEMILSLSKLASKSIILISEQIEFLILLLGSQHSHLVDDGALKCLSLLLQRGCQFLPIHLDLIDKAFNMIDDIDLSVDLQCSAFRLLHKILQPSCLSEPTMVIHEFLKFMPVVLKIARSSVMDYKKHLALCLLVDMSLCLKNSATQKWCLGRRISVGYDAFHISGPAPDEGDTLQFVHHVTVLIIDVIYSFVKNVKVDSNEAKLVQEMRSRHTPFKVAQEFPLLFDLLLHLIKEYPKLCPMVLMKLNSLIKEILYSNCSFHNGTCANLEGSSQEDTDVDKKGMLCVSSEAYGECSGSTFLVIVSYLFRFISACLNILVHSNAMTSEVLSIVKLFIENLHQSSFGHCILFKIFHLDLQSCIISDLCRVGSKIGQPLDAGSGIFSSKSIHWVHQEYLAIEFAKEMLKRRNNWDLYKVGVKSACEGLWLTATFSFRKLVKHVKSDKCSLWLKSLMLLAGAESEIKLLLHPKLSMFVVNWLKSENACGKPFSEYETLVHETIDVSIHLCDDYGGKLARIYERVHSSLETLTSARSSNDFFCFQLWFLCLRVKVLETFLHIIKLLSKSLHLEENNCQREVSEENVVITFSGEEKEMKSLVVNMVSISSRLKRLAMEYDLLAISFMDADLNSSRRVSWLALSCSLLAFCTLFPLYFSKSSIFQDVIASGIDFTSLDGSLVSSVLQDLAERLWDIDNRSALSLQEILSAFGSNHGDCMQSRTRISSFDYTHKTAIAIACRLSVSGFHYLHGRAMEVKDLKGLRQLFNEGMQLLRDIVIKLMDIPLQAPRYFFRTRFCISSELFIYSAGSKSSTNTDVSPGRQLSLNICLQLRNASLDISSKITKMYCILAASPSDCLSTLEGEKHNISDYQSWKTEVMVALNEKLFLYMKNGADKSSMKGIFSSNIDNWFTSFACFKPNDKGQGFSNCLLDVSSFPEGTYPIKWHSCCVNSDGTYWNILPANSPVFSIKNSSNTL